jgi:hypothetical protein
MCSASVNIRRIKLVLFLIGGFGIAKLPSRMILSSVGHGHRALGDDCSLSGSGISLAAFQQ